MGELVYMNMLTGEVTMDKRDAIKQWLDGSPIEVTLPGKPKMRLIWEVD